MFPHVSTEAVVCALVLSEEGNLGRTARRLHTSTSNVSRKVKVLQKTWGVQMFRRNLTGFELTEAGSISVQELRKSIQYAQRAFDRAMYLAVQGHEFYIGHSMYIHPNVLPFLQQQNISLSDVSRIGLRSAATVQLQTRVLQGEIQVGFGVMPIVDKDLYVLPVLQENFVLCIPETHGLKNNPRLAIHDVLNERIYWIPRLVHPAFYDHVAGYLRGVGYDLHNLHEARAIIEGIDFVACQSGIALLPQSAARFHRSGVLFKPLTDRLLRIETAVFARRDQMQGAVQDFIRRTIAELPMISMEQR